MITTALRALALAWLALTLTTPSALAQPGDDDQCYCPVEIENALKQGREVLSKLERLDACVNELLNGRVHYCAPLDAKAEYLLLSREVDAVAAELERLETTDLQVMFQRLAMDASRHQIDDLLGLPPRYEEVQVDECAGGGASADCMGLRHGCAGDFVCYDDDTCRCYTCTNGGQPGSCGL